MLVYTVGHSTRSLAELVSVLRAWDVTTLVDVRTVPRSRHSPQFNADVLPGALAAVGMAYVHRKDLGGLRGRKKDGPSLNTGWENESFRNYADYAQTTEFARGLQELLVVAATSTCAVMCAEAVWWRCHRRIVADYLLVHGVTVRHIFDETKATDAELTPFARPSPDGTIAYPPGAG